MAADIHRKSVRDIVRVSFVRYFVPLVAIALSGCQSSHFEVIDPPSMAHVINVSSDVVGTSLGIVYHATVVDGLVVLRLENTTGVPLQLSHSTLIDPDGVKRPIDVQTIEPRQMVKMILPPPPPDRTGGPLISIDLTGNQSKHANPTWIWPANHDVTLQLSFTRPNGMVTLQSLRIRKVAG